MFIGHVQPDELPIAPGGSNVAVNRKKFVIGVEKMLPFFEPHRPAGTDFRLVESQRNRQLRIAERIIVPADIACKAYLADDF